MRRYKTDEDVIRKIMECQTICRNGCKYYLPSAHCCNYYEQTHKRRGCKVGECDKFEKLEEEGIAKKKVDIRPSIASKPHDEYLDYMSKRKQKHEKNLR